VDSLSPKVAPGRSVVYMVENCGYCAADGNEFISIHSTKMGALKVKGRELRILLADRPPELCHEKYMGWNDPPKKIEWWMSELPEIRILELIVDRYPYWPL